jgi:antitoxin component YwqK of YwqJK toxin-antitoxin module
MERNSITAMALIFLSFLSCSKNSENEKVNNVSVYFDNQVQAISTSFDGEERVGQTVEYYPNGKVFRRINHHDEFANYHVSYSAF